MTWEFHMLDAIQTLHHPVLDQFFATITRFGDGGIFWIILGIVLFCFKRTRMCGICILVGLTIGALITNVVLKPLIARERPCWVNDAVRLLIVNPRDYSFPSGHSQASFVSATAIYLYHKKWGIAALILASLIAVSRLYLYVHYPTDVLIGMLIGIAVAVFVYLCLTKTIAIKDNSLQR